MHFDVINLIIFVSKAKKTKVYRKLLCFISNTGHKVIFNQPMKVNIFLVYDQCKSKLVNLSKNYYLNHSQKLSVHYQMTFQFVLNCFMILYISVAEILDVSVHRTCFLHWLRSDIVH